MTDEPTPTPATPDPADNNPDPGARPKPSAEPELEGHDPGQLMRTATSKTGAAGSGAGHTPPGMWEPPLPEELAPFLPAFRFVAILGRGGMGAVYRAVQSSLDRDVAIKLLPPELGADPEFEARFKREAKSMAQLNHPNIVQIYDFGQTTGGHFYFVMEYVDGADLHQLIHAGQLDSEGALNAVSQICDALEYAHTKGYVHRDIKPANIFINAEGVIKVGDFGLAKLVDAESSASATDRVGLTLTGMTMGTPHYVAPEQMAAEGNVDHRADIYSLGIMFYEMLTGEIPRGSFKPPSQKKEVDVRIDGVVFKAMEPDPDERYQTAGLLRSDVDVVRTTAPPEVAARKKPARGAKRKRPAGDSPKGKPGVGMWIGIGAAVLAVVGVLGVVLFGGGETETGGEANVAEEAGKGKSAPGDANGGARTPVSAKIQPDGIAGAGDFPNFPTKFEFPLPHPRRPKMGGKVELIEVLNLPESAHPGHDEKVRNSIPAEILGLDDVVQVATSDTQWTVTPVPGHGLALRTDGSVVSWGINLAGECDIPPEAQKDIVQVAVARHQSAALRADGHVVAWGAPKQSPYRKWNVDDSHGPANFVQISAFNQLLVALRNDGSVAAWGTTDEVDVSKIPAGMPPCVLVDAGHWHCAAVTAGNGGVIAWGSTKRGGVGRLLETEAIGIADLRDDRAIHRDRSPAQYAFARRGLPEPGFGATALTNSLHLFSNQLKDNIGYTGYRDTAANWQFVSTGSELDRKNSEKAARGCVTLTPWGTHVIGIRPPAEKLREAMLERFWIRFHQREASVQSRVAASVIDYGWVDVLSTLNVKEDCVPLVPQKAEPVVETMNDWVRFGSTGIFLPVGPNDSFEVQGKIAKNPYAIHILFEEMANFAVPKDSGRIGWLSFGGSKGTQFEVFDGRDHEQNGSTQQVPELAMTDGPHDLVYRHQWLDEGELEVTLIVDGKTAYQWRGDAARTALPTNGNRQLLMGSRQRMDIWSLKYRKLTVAGAGAETGQWVDLLPQIDPKLDVDWTSWQAKADGSLEMATVGKTFLKLKTPPPDDGYEFEIAIAKLAGAADVGLIFPIPGGKVGGVYFAGKRLKLMAESGAVTDTEVTPFLPGQAHTIVVRTDFRNAHQVSIVVLLDGDQKIVWQGNPSQLGVGAIPLPADGASAGIGAAKDAQLQLKRARFRKIELVQSSPNTLPASPSKPEADPRLTELKNQFRERYQTQVAAAHQKRVDALNQQYLGALEKAEKAASDAGNLDDVLAFQAEKERIGKNQPLPATDDPKTPAQLTTLRQTYRTELAKHETALAAATKRLAGEYDKALDVLQRERTREAKIDEALAVKAVRERLAKGDAWWTRETAAELPGGTLTEILTRHAWVGDAGWGKVNTGAVYVFNEDGTGSQVRPDASNGNAFTWEAEGERGFKLTWGTGVGHVWTVEEQANEIRSPNGTILRPHGVVEDGKSPKNAEDLAAWLVASRWVNLKELSTVEFRRDGSGFRPTESGVDQTFTWEAKSETKVKITWDSGTKKDLDLTENHCDIQLTVRKDVVFRRLGSADIGPSLDQSDPKGVKADTFQQILPLHRWLADAGPGKAKTGRIYIFDADGTGVEIHQNGNPLEFVWTPVNATEFRTAWGREGNSGGRKLWTWAPSNPLEFRSSDPAVFRPAVKRPEKLNEWKFWLRGTVWEKTGGSEVGARIALNEGGEGTFAGPDGQTGNVVWKVDRDNQISITYPGRTGKFAGLPDGLELRHTVAAYAKNVWKFVSRGTSVAPDEAKVDPDPGPLPTNAKELEKWLVGTVWKVTNRKSNDGRKQPDATVLFSGDGIMEWDSQYRNVTRVESFTPTGLTYIWGRDKQWRLTFSEEFRKGESSRSDGFGGFNWEFVGRRSLGDSTAPATKEDLEIWLAGTVWEQVRGTKEGSQLIIAAANKAAGSRPDEEAIAVEFEVLSNREFRVKWPDGNKSWASFTMLSSLDRFLLNPDGRGEYKLISRDASADTGEPLPALREAQARWNAARRNGGRLRAWAQFADDPSRTINLSRWNRLTDFTQIHASSVNFTAVRKNGDSIQRSYDSDKVTEVPDIVFLARSQSPIAINKDGRIRLPFGSELARLDKRFVTAARGFGMTIAIDEDGVPHSAFEGNIAKNRTAQLLTAEDLKGMTMLSAGKASFRFLKSDGSVWSWRIREGLEEKNEIVDGVVEIACGVGRIIGRKADGTVLSGDVDDKTPKDLRPAIAIRAGGQVYAAQMTDGSWRAWENRDPELARKIESLGPVKDIAFYSSGTGTRVLLWIE